MNVKRIIGMLIVITIIAIAMCTIFTPNTYAAEAGYTLGITNLRELQNGYNGQAAYGIGGLKSDGTPTKKVWKIVAYTNNSIDYSNAFYCIEAEHGFVSNTGTTNVSQIRKDYDTRFNMKTQSGTVLTKLNAINTAISDEQLSQATYNKIMWIIDNMYLPKASNAGAYKQQLMELAGITGYADGVLLTDDDIEVVQQLALWYFTNPKDTNYHVDSTDGPVLPVLLFNNWSGQDSNYKSLEDLYNDPVANTRLGQKRQYQAEDLYRYFINNANANYNYAQTVTSPITLDKSNYKAEQVGERYIVGPLKVTIDNSKIYNITEMKFKDQAGTEIILTGDNQLLDSNKNVVTSGNISEVIGQDMYISLPLTTNVQSVNFSLKGNYTITEAFYYTTSASTYLNEQPVVLVENNTPNIELTAPITLPAPRYLDLALRKSITKINGVATTTSRLPDVDTTNLEAGTDKTATYNHTKNELIARTNQFIEYTLTIYNEGDKAGYAAEIKDYLPAGIEFVELVSTDKYSASSVKNSDGTTTVTITNTAKNVLDKYTTGTPKNETVTLKCKVTAQEVETSQRLVNIAEITQYFDSESNIAKTADRDSQTVNTGLFPADKKNNTYAGNGVVGNYTKGQQDDDDFEPIIVPKEQDLDLALRKSITKINGVAPTTSRLPDVDTTNLDAGQTTATYNHSKNDLKVLPGYEIEYTLTVYNEGQKNAYAAEIKDYLPAGIEFVELVSTDKYSAKTVKNADGTTTITITNTAKTVLNKYTQGTVDSESLMIKCKVTAGEKETAQRLVNIAEITKYYDAVRNIERQSDIDSQIQNFPQDKINNAYVGNGVEGNYTKGQQDDDDFEPVIIPAKYFDLSLRKFITEINGKELGTSRAPQVDILKLISGESTTATYNHSKVAVSVKKGDIVTYTIRVYNEGELDGYVGEITDHLPDELEFLPEDEENLANGWYYDENDLALRTIKTNHLSKEVDSENIIKAFDGTTLSYKDVTVKCKVKDTVISGEKITNIADITEFTDANGAEVKDRDSEKNNVVLPTDTDLPNYKDEEINNTYIPGQQDDDDFEKLKVQIFDLALRKFITSVDNNSITNRIPSLSIGEDGNIKYTHTKDPVEVQTNNIVTYTLRIFNEGDISGYASEITDDLPEGLEFLPENSLNKTYRWKMIDENGNETNDLGKAVKVTTDYLSKEQESEAGKNLIKAFDRQVGITETNPDYKDIKIAFKVIEPNTSDRILTNIAQISDDTDAEGNPIEDNDSVPGNDDMTEDDIDVEHVKLVYFDLALRKFITKVDNLDVNNRYPVLSMGEDGNIKYTHTKDPVEVENGDIVTYTLRIFNEGEIDGYASEVTDNLPEGLQYLPENELNKTYRWIMIDENGNETSDLGKAVKITTDYLSKEQEKEAGANLIKAFDKETGITESNPDYKDVKVAFKVTEPNTSDRILINTAEISEDSNKDGNPVVDEDSTPGNDKDGEDDIDIEKVKVKYFDLALKKWVTQVIITENGKQTVTNTGHTGDENPEPVVKVDLKDKKLNKVTVKFAYKIKVINEGQIDGYAKEVKDYIPDGLKFVAEDNPLWKKVSDKEVVTDQLKDRLLRPGESATVDIILTWENSENNLGLKVNVAEISKDYNDSNTPDIDSVPDNKKEAEDDIDDASVILSIKTGEVAMYFVLAGTILIILAGGVILIKKYVL